VKHGKNNQKNLGTKSALMRFERVKAKERGGIPNIFC
jgi:hypothetical protein